MSKIKVPLEIVEIDKNSYHIFISVIINDVCSDILIDTGASRTVFDMGSFSEHTEVDADEIISSGLGPGRIDTSSGILKNFSVGDHTWENVNAIFMDFSHINEMYIKMCRKQIAGLIGGDFLFSTKAKINYGKSEITFSIASKKKNIFG